MKDKRKQRAWVKVQLQDTPQAYDIANIVSQWKTQRQAAAHIVKAIQLYAALCRGDLAILAHLFPGIALGVNSPPIRPHNTAPRAITITELPRDMSDNLNDALNVLGLDKLDF